ncbi:outer membrane protein assembly factor BamB family protein [Nocardiopsis oceani]
MVLLTVLAVPLTYRPVVHSVASAGSEAVPVPEDVTRVGWTWEPPEHTDLLSTDAGTRGPVFTVTDGLVALDGQAGEELWAYRQPGATEVESGVIAGGELAYVRYRDLFEGGEGTVLLDTATGEVVEEGEWPEISDPEHVLDEPVTAAGVTLRAEDPYRVDGEETVFAYESESAEPVWEHTPEGGPEELCYGEEPLPFGDTVLLGYRCAEPDLWKEEQEWEDEEGQVPESLSGPVEASVVALDARTGDELWSRDWTWQHDVSQSDRVGRLAGLNLIDGGAPLNSGAETALGVRTASGAEASVVDPATGEDVVDLTGYDWVELYGFDTGTVIYRTDDFPEGNDTNRRWSEEDGHDEAHGSRPSGWHHRSDGVLADRYLVTERGEGDQGLQLQVETHPFGAERAERVTPVEDSPDRELVFSEAQSPQAVPGAVVFLVENVVGAREQAVLYGLVP